MCAFVVGMKEILQRPILQYSSDENGPMKGVSKGRYKSVGKSYSSVGSWSGNLQRVFEPLFNTYHFVVILMAMKLVGLSLLSLSLLLVLVASPTRAHICLIFPPVPLPPSFRTPPPAVRKE